MMLGLILQPLMCEMKVFSLVSISNTKFRTSCFCICFFSVIVQLVLPHHLRITQQTGKEMMASGVFVCVHNTHM